MYMTNIILALKKIISKNLLEISDIQKENAVDNKAIGFYKIKIVDFLKLTTPSEYLDNILIEQHKLKSNYIICPYVEFDHNSGIITNHEGRHRAANAYQSGQHEMTIALYPTPKHREWKYDLSEMPEWLYGQYNHNFKIKLDKPKIDRILDNIGDYESYAVSSKKS